MITSEFCTVERRCAIRFGGFVHKRENPGGARKCGDDGIKLVGDLRHGIREVTRKRQEGDDHAKREPPRPRQAQILCVFHGFQAEKLR